MSKRSTNPLRRAWLPLLIVVVLTLGTLVVLRIRTFFGAENPNLISEKVDDTKPYNPKIVTYEVYGEPGATADISYLDLESRPQRVDAATLPWSVTLSTTLSAVSPNLFAQGKGDTLSCRIIIDDELKDERTATGASALTFCLVKSA
ncbi:MmpS family transport accessory protein [[Mycobacterium] kokjensenii]|uniref:MmpS family transport accessory protein n=1 Tax=[Mycobacterium] kokjensenii TaxID=3064287 RepID=A0ABM9LW40_9MYCO|nr:MmpS family transport accessory protein [Mycolicibacter sp. MU0083]CAJ1505693.1 MmpS family transport accessory protein [Mycolicibacter sp. MU0083]